MRKKSYAVNYDRELSVYLTDTIINILKKPRNKTLMTRFLDFIKNQDRVDKVILKDDFFVNIPEFGRYKVKFIAIARWFPTGEQRTIPSAEMAISRDLSDPTIFMGLLINKNRINNVIHRPEKYRSTIFDIISHELAHAFDPNVHNMTGPGSLAVAQNSFIDYANMDIEVTANTREMLNGLDRHFEELDKIHKGDNKKIFFALFDYLTTAQVGHWQAYTPENKTRIWKVLSKEMDRRRRISKLGFRLNPNIDRAKAIEIYTVVLSDIVLQMSPFLDLISEMIDAIDYSLKHGLPKMQESGFDVRKLNNLLHKEYSQGIKKNESQLQPLLRDIGRSIDQRQIRDFMKNAGFLTKMKSLIRSPSAYFDANEFKRLLSSEFYMMFKQAEQAANILVGEYMPQLEAIQAGVDLPRELSQLEDTVEQVLVNFLHIRGKAAMIYNELYDTKRSF